MSYHLRFQMALAFDAALWLFFLSILIQHFLNTFSILLFNSFNLQSLGFELHGFNNMEELWNSLTVTWETKQMLLNEERLAMLFNPHLF